MIDNLVTAAGLACFLFGLFVFFSAVLGLFRFDYVLNRMHAAAVGDSLGIFCVLIGLMLLHGWGCDGKIFDSVRRKDAADLCVFMADQPGVQPSGRGDGGIHSPGFGKGMRGGGTMIVLEYILLVGVIVCAIAAPLCKRLLASVIVYMALSLMMAVLWSLLQSPDLAITEAAVGAGVTSILFFLTLKKIHALKGTRDE